MMDQKNRPIPKIPESLKCFIHNPAYMQQSIMLNLVGGKQLKRTHGFILGIFVFSNQQLEFALKTLAPLVI